jgi:hypothetical protein
MMRSALPANNEAISEMEIASLFAGSALLIMTMSGPFHTSFFGSQEGVANNKTTILD